VVGCEERQDGDDPDHDEDVREQEADHRDRGNDSEHNPQDAVVPERRMPVVPVVAARVIAGILIDALVHLLAKRPFAGAPLVAPLALPFAALLAPFAVGFAARGVFRIIARVVAAIVPAVTAGGFAWRLCRFAVVGRKILADADTELCHSFYSIVPGPHGPLII